MDALLDLMTPFQLALALGLAAVAGLVKGLVGFAMPMILISGLSSFLAPELALAGLILPTLVTNGWQALGQGRAAAWAAMRKYRVFLITGGLCLLASSQLVTVLPAVILLLGLGVLFSGFAGLQLAGWRLHLRERSLRAEISIAGIAGLIGGMSGVWGPPTVAYLTALSTPKQEQMQVQGVIYGLGAVLLCVAHMGSGVLRFDTVPLSLALVAPALLGMWLGGRLQARIDQEMFRRVTLLVLLVAGANLIRRGLIG